MRLLIAVFLALLISCGHKEEEKLDADLEYMAQLLTEKKCDAALELSDEIIADGKNMDKKEVLSLRASAFACKANYSTSKFYIENLPILASTDIFRLYFDLATFYNADDIPNSSAYRYMAQAINTLLFPNGLEETSHAQREQILGKINAQNINDQALFMLLTQIGRYIKYYANFGENSEGNFVKGAGSQSNTCFGSYTEPLAQEFAYSLSRYGDNPCSTGFQTE